MPGPIIAPIPIIVAGKRPMFLLNVTGSLIARHGWIDGPLHGYDSFRSFATLTYEKPLAASGSLYASDITACQVPTSIFEVRCGA